MRHKRLWCVLLCLLVGAALPSGTVRTVLAAEQVSAKEQSDEEDDWASEEESDDWADEEETSDSVSDSQSDYQDELDALGDKLEDLKQQKEEVSSQLAAVSGEKQKKISERSTQEEQIQLTRDEIATLEERIAILEEEIDKKEQEIADKEEEIAYNYDQYKQRMRASYMAGEASTLSMVLGASDFTDFLMRTELVRASAQRDRDLLETLKQDQTELEEKQQALNEDKEKVEADESEMLERQKELEVELQSINNAIQDIALEEQQYRENQEEIDRQQAQLQAEIDAIYEKLKPQMDENSEYVGGEFAWPVPGHYQITSSYGMRWGTDFHTGTDIAGGSVYGASVRAANDGKVLLATYGNTGYGNYVIVDHGGGISTLYAHMSAISVSVGDTVTAGSSEIGKVGSTGWASGPHLHFEVRINGQHTNPMAYLQG